MTACTVITRAAFMYNSIFIQSRVFNRHAWVLNFERQKEHVNWKFQHLSSTIYTSNCIFLIGYIFFSSKSVYLRKEE